MEKLYDVIIIGGGPAGLSAALYSARAQLKTLVIEKGNIGGQITITEEVVNYPGIEKTSGWDLTNTMRRQAADFGAMIASGDVTELELEGDYKTVKTSKSQYKALSVIAATGANPRHIGFPGEEDYQGRGVAYCATCDGQFFTGLDVFVIGGGFAAAEEAMFLTRFARRVRVIVREPDFTCAKTIADKVKAYEGIDIYFNTEVKEVGGGKALEYARFVNNQTNEVWEYRPSNPSETFGVFVFAGYVPNTALFKGKLDLDKYGYIITDEKQKTSVEGVYAAGDVCIKDLRQVVTAVSDGAAASFSVEKYVEQKYEELGIDKQQMEKRSEKEKQVPPDYKQEVNRLLNEDSPNTPTTSFITSDMAEQLRGVFEKLNRPLHLTALVDNAPVSKEIDIFLRELSALSPHISCRVLNIDSQESEAYKNLTSDYPSILFLDGEDNYLGLQYHGVPGGHEFNSFVLAIYNAAGPGQSIDDTTLSRMKGLNKDSKLKVFVSLSCTMCPDVVMACQRLSLENTHIETEIFDLSHFPSYREKHSIMSVPCMVINDTEVSFGRKSADQIIDIIEKS